MDTPDECNEQSKEERSDLHMQVSPSFLFKGVLRAPKKGIPFGFLPEYLFGYNEILARE